MPCPIGTVPIVDPDQSSYGSTRPALSPGKSTPVRSPNPNRSIQEASSAPPRRSFAIVIVPTFEDSARICRTVICLRAARVGLADDPVGDVDRRRQRERRVGRHDVVLERGGDRHDLEGRPGLVEIGHRPVAALLGRRRREVVRVERRRVRHREDRAGARVHHDRRGAAAPQRATAEARIRSALAWSW